jgi:glycosyltransferase involved in cell wall biosynthesis
VNGRDIKTGGAKSEYFSTMKIYFAIKGMDTAKGGAERVLADIASGLANRGHDITLLTFDPTGGRSFYPLNPKIRRVCLGLGDVEKSAAIMETLSRIKALRATITNDKPDIVIGFMHSMFVPLSLSLIGTNIPVVGSEHIVPDHYRGRKIQFALFLLAGFFMAKITVLSSSIRVRYPWLLRRKMVVVANPVSPQTAPQPISCPPVILNIGRLDPQKDQETLIRAFALIAAKHPAWSVRIIGEGDLKETLQAVIDETGLKDRVLLAGTTQNIAAEYKSASIFALPSLYESFGLATAEAMSYGLPVIGFEDCPGTNELVQNGVQGILVKGDNRIERFAEALETFITSSEMRGHMGQAGQTRVLDYAPEKIVSQWETLVKSLTSKKHCV